MERTKHLNQDSRHETVSESNNDGSLCKEKTSCMKRATKLEYGAAVSAGVSVGGNSFLVLFRQFLVNLSLISFSLVEATFFFPFIHMFLTHFSHRGEKTVKPKFTFERKKKQFFAHLFVSFPDSDIRCAFMWVVRTRSPPSPVENSGRVGSVQLDRFTVAHFLTGYSQDICCAESFWVLWSPACCRTLPLQTAQETETFSFHNFVCSFFSVSLNNWLWAGITSYPCKQRVSRWKRVLWAPYICF